MPSHPKSVHDCGQCMIGQCMTGLLAAVFTYGTYSWPVGGSNEPQAATKKLHFRPKLKRGSGRRKSRKQKNHQPKPKKLQVLESICEHPEEQSELAQEEEAHQAPLTADPTIEIADTLRQIQEEVVQAQQSDMQNLPRGKPRGAIAAWTCKVLQRKMRTGKDSTSITDTAHWGCNPILDSARVCTSSGRVHVAAYKILGDVTTCASPQACFHLASDDPEALQRL